MKQKFYSITIVSILSLTLLVGISLQIPKVSALTDLLEDFDDETPPDQPSEDWYTFSTDASGVFRTSGAEFVSSPNSYLMDDNAASEPQSIFTFASGIDICMGSIAFNFRVSALPTVGSDVFGVQDQTPSPNAHLQINVLSTGALELQVDGSGATASATFVGVTIVANTWYKIILSIDCALVIGTGYLVDQDVSATADAAGTIAVALDVFNIDSPGGGGVGAKTYIDNLELFNVDFSPATSVPSEATVSVTGLTSFDVDREGTVIIARTNSGDFVRTYETKDTDGSLEELGNLETNCVINDGVMASEVAVGFLDCGGGTDPESLFLRSFSLDNLDVECDINDECLQDIDLNGVGLCDGFPDDNEVRAIDEFSAIPLDYRTLTRSSFDDDRAVAWAFSSSTNYVGVQQFTTQQGCDYYAEERQLFGAEIPTQISVWTTDAEEANGNLTGTFLGAVAFSSSTKLYEYEPIIQDFVLDGEMSIATTYTGLSQGVGISCATDYCIIGRATATNNIILLDTFSGETIWQKTVTSTSNKGVAISPNGQFVAYDNNGIVEIAYRFNGTVFGTATPPSGTFRGLYLDFGAQNLWIGTDDNIAWYQLEQFLPQIPSGCVGFNCVPGATPTPGATITPFLGFEGAAGNALLGIILIIVVMAITFTFFAQVSIAIAAIVSIVMGIVMFFVNVISGLFTTLLAFGVLFVIGAIVIFFKTR